MLWFLSKSYPKKCASLRSIFKKNKVFFLQIKHKEMHSKKIND